MHAFALDAREQHACFAIMDIVDLANLPQRSVKFRQGRHTNFCNQVPFSAGGVNPAQFRQAAQVGDDLRGAFAGNLDHHDRVDLAILIVFPNPRSESEQGSGLQHAVESERTSQIALERFCTHFNYEPMAFRAADAQGRAVYHTNVLMCIATEFVLIGSSMIEQTARRDEVLQRLSQSGRSVIELTENQISKFAGNAIELQGASGRILALSETALNALDPEQKAAISDSTTLVSLSIPTIELSGGSVRCTVAGIHLTPRA